MTGRGAARLPADGPGRRLRGSEARGSLLRFSGPRRVGLAARLAGQPVAVLRRVPVPGSAFVRVVFLGKAADLLYRAVHGFLQGAVAERLP